VLRIHLSDPERVSSLLDFIARISGVAQPTDDL
jgi:hypothetical protein